MKGWLQHAEGREPAAICFRMPQRPALGDSVQMELPPEALLPLMDDRCEMGVPSTSRTLPL